MALTGLTKVTNIGINTTTIPTLGGSRNTGVVTATNFIGDGSGLSGVTGSGAGVIVRDGGSLVGTAGTINFGTNLNVSAISAGIVTVTNAASATALTNLSDVTVSSASNGQILKHNGSAFVNVADTTYSQSSVASGSNVNLRLSDGSTDDDILITAGSNITFSSVSAGGFTIAASGGGGGGGLSNVVEDTTPQLGGSLDLNNKFITGSGGINVSGVTTSTSFVGNITGNVTGNTSGSSGSCTGNSATATTATNVTVSANNTLAATVYPLFAGNGATATGNLATSTDTGLNYNPSTGNLTAVKFTGSGVALTGVVTSIVAGSNITLTGGPTGIVTIAAAGGGSGKPPKGPKVTTGGSGPFGMRPSDKMSGINPKAKVGLGKKVLRYIKKKPGKAALIGAAAVGTGLFVADRIKKAISGPTLTKKDFTKTAPIQNKQGEKVRFKYARRDEKDKASPYLTPDSLKKFKTGDYKVSTKSTPTKKGTPINVNQNIKNSAFEILPANLPHVAPTLKFLYLYFSFDPKFKIRLVFFSL